MRRAGHSGPDLEGRPMNSLSRPSTRPRPARPAGSPERDAMLRQAAELAMGFRRALDSRPQKPARSFAEMRKVVHRADARSRHRGADRDRGAGRALRAGSRRHDRAALLRLGDRRLASVGVAADWLTSAWGQNTGNYRPRRPPPPARTVADGWLLDLLDLPREASVGFVTGATIANFTCLAAARGEVLRRPAGTSRRTACSARRRSPCCSATTPTPPSSRLCSISAWARARRARRRPTAKGACDADAFAARCAKHDRPGASRSPRPGRSTPAPSIRFARSPSRAATGTRGCMSTAPSACGRGRARRARISAPGWRRRLLGDRRPQMAADALRLRLRHRPRRRGAPPRHDDRRQLSARRRRPASATRPHLVPELSRRARGFATWAMIRASRPQAASRR